MRTLMLVSAVAAATLSHGQSRVYRTVITGGDPAPGFTAGSTISGMGRPTIDPSGRVAFVGTVVLPSGDRETVLYRETDAGLEPVVAYGDVLPGAGTDELLSFYYAAPDRNSLRRGFPQQSASGELFFYAATNDFEFTRRGIWRVTAEGIVENVAYTGDPVPGTDLTVEPFTNPSTTRAEGTTEIFNVSSSGDVLYKAELSGPGIGNQNDRALILVPAGSEEVVLVTRDGDPVPGRPRETFFPRDGIVTGDGTVYYKGSITGAGNNSDDRQRILRRLPDGTKEVVFSNDLRLPGFGSGFTMGDFSYDVTDGGHLIVTGTIDGLGIPPDTDRAIFSDRRGNGLELEYREGMQVPGFPAGAYYEWLVEGYMSDDLTIGFIAQVGATATTPGFTAFFTENGPLQVNPVITEGDTLPWLAPNIRIDRFEWQFSSENRGPRPVISPAGFPAMEAGLYEPGLDQSAIILTSDGGSSPMLGVEIGALVETPIGPLPVFRTAFDIEHGINASNMIATRVSARQDPWSDSYGAVVVSELAPCIADTNGDGQLAPNDFNAWILAFNNQSPACDQNGDGDCRQNDFNAWILNFNAGCE
ncbi:MAG: choice-of-anchor tandem repeat NxxGxxAF-containing protein [Planctomycetota bacterium]